MVDLHAYELEAVRLLRYACVDERGTPRSEFDTVYQRVTEGRDQGVWRVKYSSCGDLPHWLYWELGVRLPWINRQANGGWRVGRNISLLASERATAELRRQPVPGSEFGPGDTLVIWNTPRGLDAHALVVIEHDMTAGVIQTAEYGQPGGALREHVLVGKDGRLWVGKRAVRAWLPLSRVLSAGEEAHRLIQKEPPPHA